jgi:hypothetical protein
MRLVKRFKKLEREQSFLMLSVNLPTDLRLFSPDCVCNVIEGAIPSEYYLTSNIFDALEIPCGVV